MILDKDIVRCRGCRRKWVAKGGEEVCFECQERGVQVNLRNARVADALQRTQVFQDGGRFHRMVHKDKE